MFISNFLVYEGGQYGASPSVSETPARLAAGSIRFGPLEESYRYRTTEISKTNERRTKLERFW